ncbi:MAG: cytochrome C oxidase subunit IV family protein [Acidobacteriota bacterium]|nr:cytochrome C oxidase subunit IV family protein [Acidobacteriota bacterium]
MASHSQDPAHGHQQVEEHIVPVSTYLSIFVALLIATALTTWIAFQDLGNWNVVVALTIAVCKATLVVLFFMHVKYNKGLTRVVLIGALFWLGIMITFTLSDELTRHWEIYPQAWTGMIVPVMRHLLF